MNDYAISIAWITGSLLVLLLTLHLTVTRLVYRRSSGAWRWITPGLVTIGTTIVWFMLAMLLLFFFAFCSSCFGPGTPQERTFYGIIGLPFYLRNYSAYFLLDQHKIWAILQDAPQHVGSLPRKSIQNAVLDRRFPAWNHNMLWLVYIMIRHIVAE